MVDNNSEVVPVSFIQQDPYTEALSIADQPQLHYGYAVESISAEYRQLLLGFELILTEAARRIEAAPGDWMPGLADVVEGVVVYATTTKRHVHGWYCANAWHDSRSGQRFAEIVVNADLLNDEVEEVLDTLIHELVHAYAQTMGLKDTSRRGDYHNGVFADLALKAGLNVERHRTRGHATTGISQLGHQLYGELLEPLEMLLRFYRDPRPDPDHDPGGASGPVGTTGADDGDEESTPSKYVMAQCACKTDRGRPVVIRVARGNWTDDTIWCRRCDQSFTDPESGLSESPQAAAA